MIPNLSEVTEYLMLRPLLSEVPEDVLPGVVPGKTLHLMPTWHKELEDSMVKEFSISWFIIP